MKASERRLRPGDLISIPWGLDRVRGTVQEVHGPPPRQFVVVMLTPSTSGDVVDAPETVSMPADWVDVLETGPRATGSTGVRFAAKSGRWSAKRGTGAMAGKKNYRSAKTGRFVTKAQAERNPNTTVSETRSKGATGKKKK